MADQKRRPRIALWLAVAGMCVAGPAASVLIGLGGIASFAAYMDLHGFTATMRIAVVGAVACVVVPLGWWVCAAVCDRIDAKAHQAQLRALRAESRASQSSSPARHRKVA